jgi:hypothetical protein
MMVAVGLSMAKIGDITPSRYSPLGGTLRYKRTTGKIVVKGFALEGSIVAADGEIV